MDTVSIIIPAYNAEPYIGETLTSIRQQTFAAWECIVVDDGSKDATAAIVETYVSRDARFKLIRQSNAGISAARNNGFAATNANSKFVVFMDSDDIYLPHAIELLIGVLERQPEMIGAHGLAELIDQHSNPLEPGNFSSFQRARTGFDGSKLIPWGVSKPTTFETVAHHSRIYPPGLVLTRREITKKVGPFDAAVIPVEDWDMIIRLTRLGPIAWVDNVILHYRRHPTQLTTASLDRIYSATRRLRCKTDSSSENTPEQQIMLRKIRRAWQQLKATEKFSAARKAAGAGRLGSSLKLAAEAAVHTVLRLK